MGATAAASLTASAAGAYTAALEVNTIAETEVPSHASSTAWVPPTLIDTHSRGAFSHAGAYCMAARWNTVLIAWEGVTARSAYTSRTSRIASTTSGALATIA